MMKNYVISLTTQIKRREHIKNEFSRQGIPFEFFDAVTPDKVEELALKFDIKLNNEFISQSEYGCLLSHISLWQKIVDDNLPYMGIFEDDIYLGEGADSLLKDGSWLPEDFDVIHMEWRLEKVETSANSVYQYKDFYFYKLISYERGAAGYIMSYEGAKFFLDYIKHIELMGTSDDILFTMVLPFPLKEKLYAKGPRPSRYVKILKMNPTICIQDIILNSDNIQLQSSLTDLREVMGSLCRNKRTSIPYYQKIIREIIRPFKQLVNKLYNGYCSICKIYYGIHLRKLELTPLHKKD